MVYLKHFYLREKEDVSFYPYHIYLQKGLHEIEFDPITIFYGNNGSGKTTLLNIIAKTIGADERTENKTCDSRTDQYFRSYIGGCNYIFENRNFSECKIILSEDIFDYIIFKRIKNEKKELKRKELENEYYREKFEKEVDYTSYEALKKSNEVRSITMTKYVKSRIEEDDREFSNGQTALRFFNENIKENGLYILDEPENSLSPQFQIELIGLLYEMARYFKCQFIIATHSPFILSLNGAKIYNLDHEPVQEQKWYELPNVKIYYEFFKDNKKLFE